jgi:hypothetical protein
MTLSRRGTRASYNFQVRPRKWHRHGKCKVYHTSSLNAPLRLSYIVFIPEQPMRNSVRLCCLGSTLKGAFLTRAGAGDPASSVQAPLHSFTQKGNRHAVQAARPDPRPNQIKLTMRPCFPPICRRSWNSPKKSPPKTILNRKRNGHRYRLTTGLNGGR